MQTKECMGSSQKCFKKLADAVCMCIDEELKYVNKDDIKIDNFKNLRPQSA